MSFPTHAVRSTLPSSALPRHFLLHIDHFLAQGRGSRRSGANTSTLEATTARLENTWPRLRANGATFGVDRTGLGGHTARLVDGTELIPYIEGIFEMDIHCLAMRVVKTIRAGQPGAKRFEAHYGDRLICVRHRRLRARKVVTVEVIVDERPCVPDPREIVGVRVRIDEPVLRHRVREAGGVWNERARLWELSYSAVRALDLEDRIVEPMATSDHPTATSGHNRLPLPAAGPQGRST